MNTPTGAPAIETADFGGGGANHSAIPPIAKIGGKIKYSNNSYHVLLSQCSGVL